MMKIYLLTFLFFSALSQNFATVKQDIHIKIPYQECDIVGCSFKWGAVTLDSNWRWLHYIKNYDSCRNGDNWESKYCPDPKTCATNCGYEGVTGQDEYKNTYGVLKVDNGIRMNYVTKHDGGQTVGTRVYFLEGENQYKLFKLGNREFAFDVDMSTLECGMNGAIYLVEMEADGGSARYPTNKAGAKYGTGYCDAQCPQAPFVSGQANSQNWGNYGACCAQFDIWQANKQAHVWTGHPCRTPGYYRCQGNECGNGDQRYNGVCDKDGCGLNPFRNNNKQFYGPGSNFDIDTTKSFTVLTQFITIDGTDTGDINEIRRFYLQNGKKHQFPRANVSGMNSFNSMSNQNCQAQMNKFGDSNSYLNAGGTKAMGDALKRGMVLTMSLWDDYGTHMKWMDGVFPPNADPNQPGVAKGPCSASSGDPNDLRRDHPNSYILWNDFRIGTINSTTAISEDKANLQTE